MSAPGRTGNPKQRQQAQQRDEQQIEEYGDGWVSGHLGVDPELRYTSTGRAVCRLRLAHTPRVRDAETGRWADQDTIWYGIDVWGQQGENAAECLRKGDRIVVGGTFRARTYVTESGEERTVQEINAREVGPSLLFLQANVKRAQRGGRHTASGES